jgi:hypothetical protein
VRRKPELAAVVASPENIPPRSLPVASHILECLVGTDQVVVGRRRCAWRNSVGYTTELVLEPEPELEIVGAAHIAVVAAHAGVLVELELGQVEEDTTAALEESGSVVVVDSIVPVMLELAPEDCRREEAHIAAGVVGLVVLEVGISIGGSDCEVESKPELTRIIRHDCGLCGEVVEEESSIFLEKIDSLSEAFFSE